MTGEKKPPEGEVRWLSSKAFDREVSLRYLEFAVYKMVIAYTYQTPSCNSQSESLLRLTHDFVVAIQESIIKVATQIGQHPILSGSLNDSSRLADKRTLVNARLVSALKEGFLSLLKIEVVNF